MKVAVIHEWLETFAGSERTLEQILGLYPQAELFCIVDNLPDQARGFLKGRKITTSFIQRLPFAKAKFRRYLPLFPLAVEQFDLSGFDLVISNSHAVAKGVTVGPKQLHICYCCSPIRYAWDLRDDYLQQAGFSRGISSWIARIMLHYMRIWDAATAQSVDQYIAISEFIGERIRKFYGRNSVVIYPPVDVGGFPLVENKENFYLTASRQVHYKKTHLIVEAFRRMPDKQLVVIGDGPEANSLALLAKGAPNIKLMGYQSTAVLKDQMQKAKAFLFAAKEDFGIIVLEAQACGTPVIAFREGGAWETIRGVGLTENPTGLFFDEQSAESIMDAVNLFEQKTESILPEACSKNASEFSIDVFRERFSGFVEACYKEHENRLKQQRFSRPASRASANV